PEHRGGAAGRRIPEPDCPVPAGGDEPVPRRVEFELVDLEPSPTRQIGGCTGLQVIEPANLGPSDAPTVRPDDHGTAAGSDGADEGLIAELERDDPERRASAIDEAETIAGLGDEETGRAGCRHVPDAMDALGSDRDPGRDLGERGIADLDHSGGKEGESPVI